MEVRANQKFKVTKAAKIKSQDGKLVMKDGLLSTITPPKKVDDQEDTIMVRYTGQGRDNEVPNGSKFSVKVMNLVRHGTLIE